MLAGAQRDGAKDGSSSDDLAGPLVDTLDGPPLGPPDDPADGPPLDEGGVADDAACEPPELCDPVLSVLPPLPLLSSLLLIPLPFLLSEAVSSESSE